MPRGREYQARTPAFGWPDYGQPPGCINLVSLEEVLAALEANEG